MSFDANEELKTLKQILKSQRSRLVFLRTKLKAARAMENPEAALQILEGAIETQIGYIEGSLEGLARYEKMV